MTEDRWTPEGPEESELADALRAEVPPAGADFWSNVDRSLGEARSDGDTSADVVRLTGMDTHAPQPQPSSAGRLAFLAAAAAVIIAVGTVVLWPSATTDVQLAADSPATTIAVESGAPTTTVPPTTFAETTEASTGDAGDGLTELEDGGTFDPAWRASATLQCGTTADTRTLTAFEAETNGRGEASVMWSNVGGLITQLEIGDELPVDGRLGWAIDGILLGPWDVDEITDRCEVGEDGSGEAAPDVGGPVEAGGACYASIERDEQTQSTTERWTEVIFTTEGLRALTFLRVEGPEYSTSAVSQANGVAIESGRFAVSETTWIEFDVQQSDATWFVGDRSMVSVQGDDLSTTTDRIDCTELTALFDEIQLVGLDAIEAMVPFIDERISFAPGTTSGSASSAAIRTEFHRYRVEAAGGQRMVIDLDSVEDNAAIDIYTPDGFLLVREADGADVILPTNGDYIIDVRPTRGNATYEMTVTIN